MSVGLLYDADLMAAVDATLNSVVSQVVADTLKKPDPLSSSSSISGVTIDNMVEEALSDMSGEFHDLQSHLDDFLQIIRQHVITPGSPSSSSDISDWNDLSKWPNVRPKSKEHKKGQLQTPLLTEGTETKRDISKSKSQEDTSQIKPHPENDNLVRWIGRTASSQLTVEVFRRAFETGNFSEVEAIMSSYSIESQYVRGADPDLKHAIQARPRLDALRPATSEAVDSAVPVPSMMLTRNVTEYVPDELPSMTMALPSQQRVSIDSLVVEGRSDVARPVRSFSSRQQRMLELQVIKHGRHGKPKFKRLSVDTSLGVISWGTGSILMADIKQIRCGRQTHVLNRKHAAHAYEGLFASIVTPTRTVDLEMRSRTERNQVVGQIQKLVAEYLNAEKHQHVVWNRHDIDNADLDHQILVGQVTADRTPRLTSWKSALLKFVLRRTSENRWTSENL